MALRGFLNVNVLLVDFKKEEATTVAHIPIPDPTAEAIADANTTALLLSAAVDSATNANVRQFSLNIGNFQDGTIPAITGKYPNREDKAELNWRGADGSPYKMELPAPKDAIFLASDLETVDPASLLVAAITTALNTGFATTTGATVFTFVGGKRIRNG